MINKLTFILICLVVMLSCSNDDRNKKPIIEKITSDLYVIQLNDTTTIKCSAYDPDGEEVAFQWFINDNEQQSHSNKIIYSPQTDYGYQTIVCRVSDNHSIIEKNIVVFTVQSYLDQYWQSILDAQTPELTDIFPLTPISIESPKVIWEGIPGNSRILVTIYTRYNQSYEPFINDTLTTWWGDTWVTNGNELKSYIDNNIVTENRINLRLRQLLGLPESNLNQYIVQVWVNPYDLFRPSKDPEIDDSYAQLQFPLNVTQEHINWFNHYLTVSYNINGYPWTQLGYTYDWGDVSSKVGLSEFVLKNNSNIKVKSVQLAEDFFEPIN